MYLWMCSVCDVCNICNVSVDAVCNACIFITLDPQPSTLSFVRQSYLYSSHRTLYYFQQSYLYSSHDTVSFVRQSFKCVICRYNNSNTALVLAWLWLGLALVRGCLALGSRRFGLAAAWRLLGLAAIWLSS